MSRKKNEGEEGEGVITGACIEGTQPFTKGFHSQHAKVVKGFFVNFPLIFFSPLAAIFFLVLNSRETVEKNYQDQEESK